MKIGKDTTFSKKTDKNNFKRKNQLKIALNVQIHLKNIRCNFSFYITSVNHIHAKEKYRS